MGVLQLETALCLFAAKKQSGNEFIAITEVHHVSVILTLAEDVILIIVKTNIIFSYNLQVEKYLICLSFELLIFAIRNYCCQHICTCFGVD